MDRKIAIGDGDDRAARPGGAPMTEPTRRPPQRTADRIRAVPWLVRGAPWWVAVLLGLLLAAAGLFLITRPLSALNVLGLYIGISCIVSGLAELVGRRKYDDPDATSSPAGRRADRGTLFTGSLWIVAGVLILAWLGRDLSLFGPAVAILMIVSGAVAALRLLLDRSMKRVTDALFGLTEILFGMLALLWPDATLIVIAVLFGGRTLVFGVTLLLRGIAQLLGRRDRTAVEQPRRPRRWVPVPRLVTAGCVLGLAVVTTWVSHELRDGPAPTGSFYDTPESLPTAPGELIRWEKYDGDLPDGLTGFRLYYTTTDANDKIVPSTGVLALPAKGDGPFPLITWAHGTSGVARSCAPSNGPNAISEGVEPNASGLADLGWAMVSSDYPGMGAEGKFPYLVGEGEGRAVLDAARAARQLPDANVSTQTVIWGHSQGGHAALWAGQLAPTYAPELDIVGTAPLSPASNPRTLAETVLADQNAAGASLGIAFVVEAYTKYYPNLDLEELVVPAARTLVREAATRCTDSGGTLVTILGGLSVGHDQSIVRPHVLDGPFGKLLNENIPNGPWDAPLFIGQGESDEVIPIHLNVEYVDGLCADGVDVEFRKYPHGTHMSVLAKGSQMNADVVAWTKDRLAGTTSTPNCT